MSTKKKSSSTKEKATGEKKPTPRKVSHSRPGKKDEGEPVQAHERGEYIQCVKGYSEGEEPGT